MKHSNNLQLLRGAAATLAFTIHFMLVERKVKGHPGLFGDWAFIGAASVDLFFVISGFIMVSITVHRFGIAGEWKRFLLQRLTRIYPAYWAFSIGVLAVYLAKPGLVNSAQGSRVDLVASFLLLPQPLLPLLAVGWTLVHELYFYLVFTVLLAWLPEQRLPWALALWAAVVVTVERTFAGHGVPWVDLVSNPLTLNFILGGFAALWARRIDRRTAWAAIVLAGLWLVVALMVSPLDLPQIFFDRWARVAVLAVPCSLLTLGLVRIDRTASGPTTSIGAWIGDCSYSFYLCHVPILGALAKVWSLGPSDKPWDSVPMFVIGYALCVAVASGGYLWLEQPPMRAIKRWLRGRLPASPTLVVPSTELSRPRT